MRAALSIFCAYFVFGTTCAVAQQQELDHPIQFYSNGKKVDAWTRNDSAGLNSTFWFARNPAKSLVYQQQIVIVYDSEPDKAYYFDVTTKKFIGRYDFESEKYSLLPRESRRKSLKEIDHFPPAGGLPAITQMFDGAPSGNQNTLLPPPPTKRYPRLHKTSWDSNYTAADGTRVRATINFNGNRGTYRLVGTNAVGTMSEIKYLTRRSDYLITGRWALRGSVGSFSFSIPKDNVSVFWGDWGFRPGRVEGRWDGVRRPR